VSSYLLLCTTTLRNQWQQRSMQAVSGPAAWRRHDFQDGEWAHVLTAGQLFEIDACVRLHAKTPR